MRKTLKFVLICLGVLLSLLILLLIVSGILMFIGHKQVDESTKSFCGEVKIGENISDVLSSIKSREVFLVRVFEDKGLVATYKTGETIKPIANGELRILFMKWYNLGICKVEVKDSVVKSKILSFGF